MASPTATVPMVSRSMSNANANIVTSVEAMNNKTTDMLDLSKCGNSSWFGNQFASASPSACIN